MELLLSILASLIIALSPQASDIEPLTSTEIGIEVEYTDDFGDVGAEEVEDNGVEAFGFNVVEEAQNIIDNLSVTPSDREDPFAYEYVATFDGGTPEFDSTHFTIESPTHPGVEHVIHVVNHWKA